MERLEKRNISVTPLLWSCILCYCLVMCAVQSLLLTSCFIRSWVFAMFISVLSPWSLSVYMMITMNTKLVTTWAMVQLTTTDNNIMYVCMYVYVHDNIRKYLHDDTHIHKNVSQIINWYTIQYFEFNFMNRTNTVKYKQEKLKFQLQYLSASWMSWYSNTQKPGSVNIIPCIIIYHTVLNSN